MGVSPTKVRKVPQDSCQLPERKGFRRFRNSGTPKTGPSLVGQFWGLDSDRILKLVLREIILSQEINIVPVVGIRSDALLPKPSTRPKELPLALWSPIWSGKPKRSTTRSTVLEVRWKTVLKNNSSDSSAIGPAVITGGPTSFGCCSPVAPTCY